MPASNEIRLPESLYSEQAARDATAQGLSRLRDVQTRPCPVAYRNQPHPHIHSIHPRPLRQHLGATFLWSRIIACPLRFARSR